METDPSEVSLTPSEIRALGSLMEKSVTTPEYYPMTLNGLVNACNQKTSRDPVTELEEDEVLDALDSLREKRLVMRVDFAGSRVPKFKHLADSAWELKPSERAILTVLFLRGAQTTGQIRQRTDRLYAFPDLKAVEEALESMENRELPPEKLVKRLPRHPGTKDVRFIHFLADEELLENIGQPTTNSTSTHSDRSVLAGKVAELEDKIRSLESDLSRLEERFSQFENEFK